MKTLVVSALLVFAGGAQAAALNVPQIDVNRTINATYRCAGGDRFKVTYLNGDNGQSFAVVPYQGKSLLMVNTMAADGVMFQAGFVTWRIKGRNGSLSDVTKDPNQPVLTDCKSI